MVATRLHALPDILHMCSETQAPVNDRNLCLREPAVVAGNARHPSPISGGCNSPQTWQFTCQDQSHGRCQLLLSAVARATAARVNARWQEGNQQRTGPGTSHLFQSTTSPSSGHHTRSATATSALDVADFESAAAAGKSAAEGGGQMQEAVSIPAILLGDVFMPCNMMSTLLTLQKDRRSDRRRSPKGFDASVQLMLKLAMPLNNGLIGFFVSKQDADIVRQECVLRKAADAEAAVKEATLNSVQLPPPTGLLGIMMGKSNRRPAPDPAADGEAAEAVAESPPVRRLRRLSSGDDGQPPQHLTDDLSRKVLTALKNARARAAIAQHDSEDEAGAHVEGPTDATAGLGPPHDEEQQQEGASTSSSSSRTRHTAESFLASIRRAEAEATLQEVKAIKSGEPSSSKLPISFSSYVAQIALESAVKLMGGWGGCQLLPPTAETAFAGALMRSHASCVDLWQTTVERLALLAGDHELGYGGAGQESLLPPPRSFWPFGRQAESREELGGGQTPVFSIPGVALALQTDAGPVSFSPAFLSLDNLHRFAATCTALYKKGWLLHRKLSRDKWRQSVEAGAVSLAGLGLGYAGGAARGDGDEDEDTEGWGDPPEAKALMEEMGEGRSGAAVALAAGPPPGALEGVLSTIAVGTTSLMGHIITGTQDVADSLIAASPVGCAYMGIPQHIAVRAEWLEQRIAECASANAAHMASIAAHPIEDADDSVEQHPLPSTSDAAQLLPPSTARPSSAQASTAQRGLQGNQEQPHTDTALHTSSGQRGSVGPQGSSSQGGVAPGADAGASSIHSDTSGSSRPAADSALVGRSGESSASAGLLLASPASTSSLREPEPAPPLQLVSLDALKSVVQAMWMLGWDLQAGHGRMAMALLGAHLSGSGISAASVTTQPDGRLSLHMKVEVKSVAIGAGDDPLAAATSDPRKMLQRALARAQQAEPDAGIVTHEFELGLHITPSQLLPKSSRGVTAVTAEAGEQEEGLPGLQGILLVGDLGLEPQGTSIPFRSPPVGYANMGPPPQHH